MEPSDAQNPESQPTSTATEATESPADATAHEQAPVPTMPAPQMAAASSSSAATAHPAKTPGIIMLVCAGVMALGMVTGSWGTAREGRGSISAGLLDIEGCGRGHCETLGWDKGSEILDIPSDVNTLRMLGLLAGLLALGGMIAAGVLAIEQKLAKIPVKPIQIGLGIASFCLTYFAFSLAMADRDVDFGPGYSAFLAIGALIVGSYVLQKQLNPLVEQAKSA